MDIIKDAVFTAISTQHALILKSEALVEIGGGVSGVVIEIYQLTNIMICLTPI